MLVKPCCQHWQIVPPDYKKATGQEALLTESDVAPLDAVMLNQADQHQIEVLFQELLAQRGELSTEVLEWIIGRYHQNKLGAWFVFTEAMFNEMIPLDWRKKSMIGKWLLVRKCQEFSSILIYSMRYQ